MISFCLIITLDHYHTTPAAGIKRMRRAIRMFENENNVSRKGAKSAKIDGNGMGKGIKENSAIFAAWREK